RHRCLRSISFVSFVHFPRFIIATHYLLRSIVSIRCNPPSSGEEGHRAVARGLHESVRAAETQRSRRHLSLGPRGLRIGRWSVCMAKASHSPLPLCAFGP